MTDVLALKPGHDGAAAFISGGELVYSHEGEKDGGQRNSPLTAAMLLEALAASPSFPDVVALGGWERVLPGWLAPIGAGYAGLEPGRLTSQRMFGRDVAFYSSSHERSHLYGGVALSPFDPESELAILLWEGQIGGFYRWSGPRKPIERTDVLDQPGGRYAALFCLADERFADSGEWPPTSVAGKLMALVGLADDRPPSRGSIDVVESLLNIRALYPFHKARYQNSGLYNCGATDPELCRAARYLSERLFGIYLTTAHSIFPPGLPLVIVGGCGLNCDWNAAWRNSGLFSDVFVPPVANDSGSAIGTAVDAFVQMGGKCTLDWDVYRGPDFVHDTRPETHGWRARTYNANEVSGLLAAGEVVAWVKGRCEIGPRALGNRSLLASSADASSHERLNTIKQRESYRPIAPVCLEEDLGVWFDDPTADPYMLYFRRVASPDRMPAVTHIDGSARAQSVTELSNPPLHELLTAHRTATGIGVLCNTSLNFNGRGFINRTSELLHYCDQTRIAHIVIDNTHYTRTENTPDAGSSAGKQP